MPEIQGKDTATLFIIISNLFTSLSHVKFKVSICKLTGNCGHQKWVDKILFPPEM